MPKGPRQRPAERYRLKYSRLRRAARALVFENGALCDEVARLEAKCLRARDERRFLLTRLLQLQAAAGPEDGPGGGPGRRPRRGGSRAEGSRDGGKDGARSAGARDGPRPAGPRDGPRPAGPRDGGRPAGARDGPGDGPRAGGPRDGPRPTGPRDGPRDEPSDGPRPTGPRDGPGTTRGRAGPEVAPSRTCRRAVPRPPEGGSGPAGRPAAVPRPPPRRRGGASALPLALGPLTVHSLGAGGAGPGAALPLGFHSTRLFASARRPARRCLYTCRIAAGPRCEIVAEDEPGRVLAGPTPDACHGRLLQALGEAGGRPRAMPPAPGAGADFFGLTHPAVRRLLRGEAGAFLHPDEEEEEEEEEDDDDDDEDEDDEEEEDEEGAAPAFTYADVFLGSPAGSDE
ncbi:LOW QUALITY PROTEIN: transforming growth factor beta regulator 1-like [Ciconia boyciana]|uniref:LOW QUALITY PROTEIN: transforming growth factor beta regulator 1-like n=1 Tax=Ciconia boyciana TaxID=52775 RepID=UPI003BA39D2C